MLSRPLRIRAAPHWLPTPASVQLEHSMRCELPRLAQGLAAMGARMVVLFGSMARGHISETSDLDLIVVMETSERFVNRAIKIVAALQPRVPVDLLVYTPGEFKQMRERPFVQHALAEGQVLYAADA